MDRLNSYTMAAFIQTKMTENKRLKTESSKATFEEKKQKFIPSVHAKNRLFALFS